MGPDHPSAMKAGAVVAVDQPWLRSSEESAGCYLFGNPAGKFRGQLPMQDHRQIHGADCGFPIVRLMIER
jgi:hypothetical protein